MIKPQELQQATQTIIRALAEVQGKYRYKSDKTIERLPTERERREARRLRSIAYCLIRASRDLNIALEPIER